MSETTQTEKKDPPKPEIKDEIVETEHQVIVGGDCGHMAVCAASNGASS